MSGGCFRLVGGAGFGGDTVFAGGRGRFWRVAGVLSECRGRFAGDVALATAGDGFAGRVWPGVGEVEF